MSRDENKDENVAAKLQYNALKEAIFLEESRYAKNGAILNCVYCAWVFFIREREVLATTINATINTMQVSYRRV